MNQSLGVMMAGLALAAFGPHIADAQSYRDDTSYTRGMPNGCTGVKKLSASRFVLEECTLNGVKAVKASSAKTLGKGIALLTFGGSHSNYSGYYCSAMATGLPQGYSRQQFKCTSSGWQLHSQ